MAKKSYLAASEEGAAYAQVEVGETVELDLDEGEELALVAAGWLEPEKKTTKKEEK